MRAWTTASTRLDDHPGSAWLPRETQGAPPALPRLRAGRPLQLQLRAWPGREEPRAVALRACGPLAPGGSSAPRRWPSSARTAVTEATNGPVSGDTHTLV